MLHIGLFFLAINGYDNYLLILFVIYLFSVVCPTCVHVFVCAYMHVGTCGGQRVMLDP